MKSRWRDDEARALAGDPLALRVYSSRLLGIEPDLVLHGGGNTSVKTTEQDFFGDEVEVLYVKGSGWDLAHIEKAGFAPVRLDVLQRLARFETLADTDLVRQQRLALLDPAAPDPSVEAVLHAVIPKRYVDHTHADAVVTLTNTPDAERIVREVYGERVLVVPYVMPGFTLARAVYALTRATDWDALEGLLLMNHGLFTFADTAKASYEQMLALVSRAEAYLEAYGATPPDPPTPDPDPIDPVTLATLRQQISKAAGKPLLGLFDSSPEALRFAQTDGVTDLATRGPLTPDHVIRTKPVPLVYEADPERSVRAYAEAYGAYFERHAGAHHTRLDPAPRWVVVKGFGSLNFGEDAAATHVVRDVARHTAAAILQAEALGGWRALGEKDLFEMEYWDLEQAKLGRNQPLPLAGRVALVTGAAQGIGRACARRLRAQGAAVVTLDLVASGENSGKNAADPGWRELTCDVTDADALTQAIRQAVETFGGIDMLVSNAGIFPPSQTLDVLDGAVFERSWQVNLNAHRKVLRACLPYLVRGWHPAVVLMASKNVPAPGPGAAAYSVAKAGLTQLGRVAALELAPKGVRVNILHPDAVYDTGFWTDTILQQRADSYGLSVEAYKNKSLLGAAVTSEDVAAAVVALAGDTFSKTTGAQVPVDGGNARVI